MSLIDEDEALIAAALNGSAFAWEKLVRRYEARIYNQGLRLMGNSADAMDGTGVIAVEKKIQSGRAVVRIRDTGRGIATADQRKIFEPGFTSKSRGWGLGLSLAKRIIEEYHGGKLTLEQSIPGEGTTFKISLPLA